MLFSINVYEAFGDGSFKSARKVVRRLSYSTATWLLLYRSSLGRFLQCLVGRLARSSIQPVSDRVFLNSHSVDCIEFAVALAWL